jgi:hypothetical protein
MGTPVKDIGSSSTLIRGSIVSARGTIGKKPDVGLQEAREGCAGVPGTWRWFPRASGRVFGTGLVRPAKRT